MLTSVDPVAAFLGLFRVPFLTVALVFDRLRPAIGQLSRHARLVESVSGGLLVLVGLLPFPGQFALVPQWFGPLARSLPQG